MKMTQTSMCTAHFVESKNGPYAKVSEAVQVPLYYYVTTVHTLHTNVGGSSYLDSGGQDCTEPTGGFTISLTRQNQYRWPSSMCKCIPRI